MKKIISLLLTLALLASMLAVGAVSASAAGTSAPSWLPMNNKTIYFYADPELWMDYNTITLFFYSHKTGEQLFSWGNNIGKMSDVGNNIWSFDCDAKGLSLNDGEQYGVIFTADWNAMTMDLIFETCCLGDMAYAIKDDSVSPSDTNKLNHKAAWVNADCKRFGTPKMINSMGEVVGDVCWSDQTPYDLLTEFLDPDSTLGILGAVKYNGKTVRQTAEDAAAQLGLSVSDLERAAEEAGIDLDNAVIPTDPSTSPIFLFYADPAYFKDPKNISAYIYTKGDDPVYPWGSSEWEMTDLDYHYWIFDCSEHNIILNPFKESYVIITVDGKTVSNDLPLSGENYAKIITPTGRFFGGSSDDDIEFEAMWRSEWDEKPAYFRFYADPELFRVVNRVTVFLYETASGTGWELLDGESEESDMEYLGDNMWGYDLDAHGITLDPDKGYQITVYVNDKDFSKSIEFSEENFGQTIYPEFFDGGTSFDRRRFIAEWHAVAPDEYFPPNHYVIPGWEKHDDGKIYFFVGSGVVHDFTSITCNVYNITTGDEDTFYLDCEGNAIWSLDILDCGYDLGEESEIYIDFDFEWGYDNHEATSPLRLTADTLGDLAIIDMICHSRDLDKYSYVVGWYSEFVNRGDVDGDGVLSINDATLLQRHLAEFTQFDGSALISVNWPTDYANADCNCDGVVNINDVTAIQRALAEFVS